MKQTIALTAAAVTLVVAVALSVLAILTARAGQQHGLDCANSAQICGR